MVKNTLRVSGCIDGTRIYLSWLCIAILGIFALLRCGDQARKSFGIKIAKADGGGIVEGYGG